MTRNLTFYTAVAALAAAQLRALDIGPVVIPSETGPPPSVRPIATQRVHTPGLTPKERAWREKERAKNQALQK